MIRSLQISQFISSRNALFLGVPGVLAGAVILSASSASALSLSLDLKADLPLLPPVSAAVEASLLDGRSNTLAGVFGTVTTPAGSIAVPPVTVPTPSVPPLAPPEILPPAPSQPEAIPPAPAPIRPSATPRAPAVASAAKVSAQNRTPDTLLADMETKSSPQSTSPLDFPGNFDFMPKIFSGGGGNFQAALIILTSMAVLFLAFATFTTARLARGSPKL